MNKPIRLFRDALIELHGGNVIIKCWDDELLVTVRYLI